MNEILRFKLKIDIPDLDIYWPNEKPCALLYNCELTIGESDVHDIELRINYDPDEYLDHKFMTWADRNNNNFLSKLEAIEFYAPSDLCGLSFNGFEWKEITTSRNEGQEYLVIKLRGIKIVYINKNKNDSAFYLTKGAAK